MTGPNVTWRHIDVRIALGAPRAHAKLGRPLRPERGILGLDVGDSEDKVF